MHTLSELKVAFLQWDGELESAETLLTDAETLLTELQQRDLREEEVSDATIVIQEYRKLITFLQQEKNKAQREAARMQQSGQKVRDYVRFNQTSGFEFYY